MDLRTRTTLLCGALALAIAASILLRGRTRTVHLVFAAFAADIGLWYLAQAFYGWFQATIWVRFTAILAVALPVLALQLFEAIVPHERDEKSRLLRARWPVAIAMSVVVLSPIHRVGIVRGAVLLGAFVLVVIGLFALDARGRKSRSKATQRRVRFLAGVGALATTFSLADFLWFVGAELPPVGAVLSIVFLFVLAESLRIERLLDSYELLGRLLVSTALAFVLAGIFYVFVTFVGGFATMYLNAVLAALAILVLFEPLRAKVEQGIHRVFLRERIDLERSLADARRSLVHALELDELGRLVVGALEQSRRATAAALYLPDAAGDAFGLAAGFGDDLPPRVDPATARALLERVARGPVVLEEVRRAADAGGGSATDEARSVRAAAEVLGPLREGVVLPVRAERGALGGILAVADARVRDAYAPEEVALLEGLAAQIGVVVENSRAYRRLQERDRLAALGQMAAGLAHEVKNPLGAIKGAAQLLADPSPADDEHGATPHELLGIILEEVDRLDRVVGSILDYARPSSGNPAPVDVNAVVRRTVQILASDRSDDATIELRLADDLPRVRIDAEQLRQVLMNLVRNAAQAMSGRGTVVVATRVREAPIGATAPLSVELAVTDSGAGMSQKVLQNLFVPFFSTKEHGTGLGLAVSDRIVRGAGGAIDVRSHEGRGTTVAVVLPASSDPRRTPRPGEAAPESSADA